MSSKWFTFFAHAGIMLASAAATVAADAAAAGAFGPYSPLVAGGLAIAGVATHVAVQRAQTPPAGPPPAAG